MNIDWSKAPGWAKCVIKSLECGEDLYWAEQWGMNGSKRCRIGCETKSRQTWHVADMSSANHAWVLIESRDDNVLPPIGSTVRIDKGDRIIWDVAEMFIGVDVTLVATFKTGDTQMVAVEHPVEKQCCCFRADMVRTLEQIAAEERDKTIGELKLVFDSCSDELMPTSNKYLETLFGTIYDAGYRKQVTK